MLLTFIYSTYAELTKSYRDIALIRALYWRMMPVFRCLINLPDLIQTPIFDMAKGIEMQADDQVDEMIEALLNEPGS